MWGSGIKTGGFVYMKTVISILIVLVMVGILYFLMIMPALGQKALQKEGFVPCGRVYMADGAPRIGFQKLLQESD